MKHLFLGLFLLPGIGTVSAQSVKLQPGTPFKTVTDIKVNTNLNFAGQDIETSTNAVTTALDTIKSVLADGYTYSATIKHIKGEVKVMGQDQTFDSDDQNLRNNPEMADLFKALNTPNNIEIKNGKMVAQSQKLDAIVKMGGSDDQAKYVLTLDPTNIKEGYSWTDSTLSDSSSKTVTNATVKQVTDQSVVVEIQANIALKETMNRNGMDIVQNLTGKAFATRTYNKNNGLLMNETSNVNLTGTMEMMGQSAPITSKGTIVTTIQ
ncbi:hypothetical protein [Hydrotalea sp.]|uniref:hypothetical protein n=1 Tax=Hydrotalea sp. TaxID=2881279 RepID=UPI00260DC76F|nr:hypothetical protein [Hydrotalea sp.]